MMITNSTGKILAHSDPAKVDEIYENMPDIENLGQQQQLFHRVIQSEDAKKVFQVFKRFTPASRKFRQDRPEPPPCNPGSPPLCRGARKKLPPECILKHEPDADEFNNEKKKNWTGLRLIFFPMSENSPLKIILSSYLQVWHGGSRGIEEKAFYPFHCNGGHVFFH